MLVRETVPVPSKSSRSFVSPNPLFHPSVKNWRDRWALRGTTRPDWSVRDSQREKKDACASQRDCLIAEISRDDTPALIRRFCESVCGTEDPDEYAETTAMRLRAPEYNGVNYILPPSINVSTNFSDFVLRLAGKKLERLDRRDHGVEPKNDHAGCFHLGMSLGGALRIRTKRDGNGVAGLFGLVEIRKKVERRASPWSCASARNSGVNGGAGGRARGEKRNREKEDRGGKRRGNATDLGSSLREATLCRRNDGGAGGKSNVFLTVALRYLTTSGNVAIGKCSQVYASRELRGTSESPIAAGSTTSLPRPA
ncbi:hypothetical protein WN48_08134 [Eufriesea mexicana]|uniref:Uncharacterized protein n=1 Tax=Eufriesea mexicana TaxID=516756 RepID=A0A310S833_9HYME|nr:hypothetical protein WN48_08134 [Eufriesea mexicana]